MFGLFPQFQRKSYDILYCTCSTLFLICRRKAMISNIFHLFLQFQFLNSSLLFNLPSFAILLVTPFSTTAFAAIHNYSYSISFPVLNFIEMLNNREIKFYTSGSIWNIITFENLRNHLEEEGIFEIIKAKFRYVYILGFDQRNILRIF